MPVVVVLVIMAQAEHQAQGALTLVVMDLLDSRV
tara:strand:+ start:289 stop:390 length:102 start_codon:yes stop_codon:yes gene_type:complete